MSGICVYCKDMIKSNNILAMLRSEKGKWIKAFASLLLSVSIANIRLNLLKKRYEKISEQNVYNKCKYVYN